MASCLDSLFDPRRYCSGPAVGPQPPEDQPGPPFLLAACLLLTGWPVAPLTLVSSGPALPDSAWVSFDPPPESPTSLHMEQLKQPRKEPAAGPVNSPGIVLNVDPDLWEARLPPPSLRTHLLLCSGKGGWHHFPGDCFQAFP